MPQEKRVHESTRRQRALETLVIFRRSLIYQTKEFFQNSTLHGVRYIAETVVPSVRSSCGLLHIDWCRHRSGHHH
ncbi:GL16415 [Drosophila persimilis]|uniref:GL16415 n=1 Tax=Drosophila persimilis TaxID=7234 RepID=B4GWL0_DROPE|nr:GL16415 [Drosophila persimilis]